MTTKTAYYTRMAEEAARQVTGSREQWTAFLTTAARLYKYPYPEQLMIFTQRPDATACAEYDLWNDRMNRYVKRGSKGIALVDTSGEEPRLRYVFDVADTGTRRNSRPVYLWKMTDEHIPAIQKMLADSFGATENQPLEDQIQEAARKLASEYWQDHKNQVIDIVADGDVEIGEAKECECYLYVDWDLETIPEKLQKHFDEVVREGKRRAFEQRKAKHLENGYQTLEEFERDCPVKIEKPYLGIRLDTREKELNASLHINGYDCAEKGIWIEFHHRESVAIDQDVLLELMLTAIRKATPSEQTMEPVAEDY